MSKNAEFKTPPEVPEFLQGAAPEKHRETAAERAQRIRDERSKGRPRPLDGMTLKLQVYGEVPGYHLCIMNDSGNILTDAQKHGYDFVEAHEIEGTNSNVTSYNTDPGNKVRFIVGTNEGGEPMYAYLMKYPEELWQEDEAAREARHALIDQSIRAGKVPGETDAEQDKKYIPKQIGGRITYDGINSAS